MMQLHGDSVRTMPAHQAKASDERSVQDGFIMFIRHRHSTCIHSYSISLMYIRSVLDAIVVLAFCRSIITGVTV